ncbi:MAG TPA: hypothetical protein VMM37_06835 [Bacteroidota bacterium]|nr:hypothetical protein [Bacteroidota bacterium]
MGYIFEEEIERIMHAVRVRTIGEEETITLRGILSSGIHPAIKAYFRAEVQRQLNEERTLEVRSKKFPYALPEIAGLQRQMDLLLVSNYQFDRHEFDTLLDQAVHFTFNFLCRPQFTLVEFLFENQRQQSTMKIEQKLDYCVDYEYFSLLLKRYFVERGLATIGYEEFKTLLASIDSEVVAKHSATELASMTKPIMRFVDAVRDHPPTDSEPATLPVNAAIVFFEDKHLDELKLRLEYERDHHGLKEIGVKQLADFIDEVRGITTGRRTESVVGEPEPTPGPEPDQPPEDEHRAEAAKTQVREAVAVQTEENTPAPPEVARPLPDEQDLTQRTEIATPPPPKIISLLSGSDRKKISKAIFHKDEDEFDATVALMDKAGSWEEASLILDDLFLAKGIDPQSRTAILLTEKVYQRFHPATE